MRIEVVAVGTELLLGQIADTNSAWLGEQLALGGVDSHFHQAVGDNLERIVLALRTALARSDGAVVCGGLGPTHDDITRDAIAEVMGVALVRDPAIVERIGEMFSSRGRAMPESNGRQADVPVGATPIIQMLGTAPGLVCPVGHKVIYALPGVPYEMYEMFSRAVLPDLRRRMADQGDTAVISSRVVRTWGMSESGLAELLAPRIEALDAAGGNPTIAFLASGIEGIKVRITAKAADSASADALLDAEEKQVRALVGEATFGVDDDTMESVVGALLKARGLTLGLAESLTGGLVSSRLVAVPGASDWFRGSVVSYASDVKYDVLGVPAGPVVSEEAAR
ncbi:MAG TPA: CinA family nicotinamide mononucleotide deamidase-related protein, partial [Acidimicrobiales bacterium]